VQLISAAEATSGAVLGTGRRSHHHCCPVVAIIHAGLGGTSVHSFLEYSDVATRIRSIDRVTAGDECRLSMFDHLARKSQIPLR